MPEDAPTDAELYAYLEAAEAHAAELASRAGETAAADTEVYRGRTGRFYSADLDQALDQPGLATASAGLFTGLESLDRETAEALEADAGRPAELVGEIEAELATIAFAPFGDLTGDAAAEVWRGYVGPDWLAYAVLSYDVYDGRLTLTFHSALADGSVLTTRDASGDAAAGWARHRRTVARSGTPTTPHSPTLPALAQVLDRAS